MPAAGQASAPDTPSPFQGCWERIARAEFNANSIGTDWKQLHQGDIYSAFTKDNRDGTFSFIVKGKPLPAILSLKFGEVLYQLRAALDGLIYKAAILDEGKSPPSQEKYLQFPVCDSDDIFNNDTTRRQLGKLSKKRTDIVESVQPYKSTAPRNSGLWMLNDLARRDRHRQLHVVACWFKKIDIKVTPDPETISAIRMGYLKDELELATVKPRDEDIGVHFHAEVETPSDIGIDGIAGELMSQTVDIMLGSVSDVVRRFESSF